MVSTPSHIGRNISIVSAVIITGLVTVNMNQAKETSFNPKSSGQVQSPVKNEGNNRYQLSQIWNQGKGNGFMIDQRFKVDTTVVPADPIDFNQVEVDLDPDFQLNL